MPLCRICKGMLTQPLLTLKNVPAAAQKMPSTPKEVSADKGIDLPICQCLNCGVLQHTVLPVPYFREVIRASGVSEAMRQFRRAQFRSWIERYDLAGKKVFEAGCGRGEYLELMKESGADAYGIEFGDAALSHCRAKGLNVSKAFFETGNEKLPSASFDGFFVLNFLEHIPDIPLFLKAIRNNLSAGAPGIVEVPNLDMILANSQLTEFSTEHLCYFTRETLCTTLQSHGFEVLNCHPVWHDYIISAEVIKRKPVNLNGCAAVAEHLQEEITHFISRCGKTAFWGAGHQALTTLALCGINKEKICFVVDSSPEKQHRFTFATHIPIVSPEALTDPEIKGVIITCGGYSDEVAGIIRKNFQSRIKLAILRENKLEYL